MTKNYKKLDEEDIPEAEFKAAGINREVWLAFTKHSQATELEKEVLSFKKDILDSNELVMDYRNTLDMQNLLIISSLISSIIGGLIVVILTFILPSVTSDWKAITVYIAILLIFLSIFGFIIAAIRFKTINLAKGKSAIRRIRETL